MNHTDPAPLNAARRDRHLPCARIRFLIFLLFALSFSRTPSVRAAGCTIAPVTFDGWHAQQISNEWLKVIIVPQLGGRVMQVSFNGHAYLFINSRFKGQYFPPSEGAAKGRWFNYGGDKVWPLPEGTQDEQHWAGPLSDNLDDGEYAFKILSQDAQCTVELTGPPDERTGLQFSRQITLRAGSPQISFHNVMKNISAHPIEWSMQTVSQYDTSSAEKSGGYNQKFFAFTPVNPRTVYPGFFRVRAGLSNDPSFSVKDGLFTLHWMDLQNEVWLDSPGGWVAVVDAASQYAMVERFPFDKSAPYPGDASVIFYKNGQPPDRKKPDAAASSSTSAPPDPDDVLLYMEAELNSPLVQLQPGETYAMDTNWFPARSTLDFTTVTDAGIVSQTLRATAANDGVLLSGAFGVFFPGKLVARLYDSSGVLLLSTEVATVSPANFTNLNQKISAPGNTARVSLHLIDSQGGDRGGLGEARISPREGSS